MATLRNSQGQLFDVDDGELDAALKANPDLSPASDDEIRAYDAAKARRQEFGSTGQQALAIGEQVVRTATWGAVPGLDGNAEREAELRAQSPFLSMGAQAVGTVAAARLGGAAAGAGARAAGLGARAIAAAVVAGEGVAAGLADEVEQARFERRQVSAGNVLLYGLGGELLGRAVPALARRGLRGAAERVAPGVADAAARESLGLDDVADNLLVSSERKAHGAAIDTARDLPPGPQRDEYLIASEAEIIDTAATRGAKALDEIRRDFAELGDVTLKPKRVEKLIAKTNRAQRDWAPRVRSEALDLVDQVLGRNADGTPNGAPIGGEELGAMRSKVAKTLRTFSKELGDANSSTDWFLAADRAKRSLQRFRSTLSQGARRAQDPAAHEALGAAIQGFAHRLRLDLEDTSKWGRAGELQQSVNAAWSDRYLKGASVAEADLGRKVGRAEYETGVTPHRYDPGKLRAFLRSDAVGRGLTPEHLENVLAGAEDMLATHRRFGTAAAAQLERLERNVARLRDDLALADELQATKRRVTDQAAQAKAASKAETAAARVQGQAQAARDELLTDAVMGGVGAAAGAFLGGWAGAAVMGAAKLMRYWRLTNTLSAASDAASKTAARGAVRGLLKPASQLVGKTLEKAPAAAVPAFATALSRFSEGYPDAQASYEAKRQAIEQAHGDPVLLARALASSIGELPSMDPALFADLSIRLTAAVDYLFRNLPAQVSVSMTHPRGIPLSRQALRDFAILWNSTLVPHTVLEDVATGMVSPKQIRAFRAVHPDRYQRLQADLTAEIANNYADVPTQRKVKWDIVLGLDGAAGKAYSSAMSRSAARYRERLAQQRSTVARGAPGGGQQSTGVQPARALSNIGAGVTSSG